MLKTIPIFILGLCLGTILFHNSVLAQGSVTQLEYRLRRLESQVSQLAGQIGNLRNQSGTYRVEVVPGEEGTPPPVNNRFLSGDPMFDNLATLVIELKQDFRALEERVSELESQNNESSIK